MYKRQNGKCEVLDEKFWKKYWKYYPLVFRFIAYKQMIGEAVQALAGNIRLDRTAPILDAGCGSGKFSHAVRELYPNCPIRAIDTCKAALNIAADAKANSRITWLDESLDDTPGRASIFNYEVGSFAAVVSMNSYYATKDPAATMKQIAKILRPGGMLIIATPKAGASKQEIMKHHIRTRGVKGFFEAMCMLPKLLFVLTPMGNRIERTCAQHFFTEEGLRRLAQAAGLEDIVITLTYAGQDLFLTAFKPK